MASVNVEMILSSSGRKIQVKKLMSRINEFEDTWRDLPEKLKKEIPSNIASRYGTMVRRYFRANYDSKYLWRKKTTAPGYATVKQGMLDRKDSFDIASIGNFPVTHGPSEFGKRTGTLYKYLGRAEAVSTQTRWNLNAGFGANRKSVDAMVIIILNHKKFDGDYYWNRVRKDGSISKIRQPTEFDNEMIDFSWYISRSGTPDLSQSPLIQLTGKQAINIRKMSEREFGLRTRNLLIGLVRGITR